MCANSLGALYIYRCVLFCKLKEDTEERNPCIWDVVVVEVWCCLSATVADSGSRFALVAVRLRGFIGDCLHLRRSFLYVCLWRFAFVIYDGFSTGGKREEKIISSVFQSSVWLLPLFILFLRIGSPKNESSVMIYLPSCSTKPVWVSFFLQWNTKDKEYPRHSIQYNMTNQKRIIKVSQMTHVYCKSYMITLCDENLDISPRLHSWDSWEK